MFLTWSWRLKINYTWLINLCQNIILSFPCTICLSPPSLTIHVSFSLNSTSSSFVHLYKVSFLSFQTKLHVNLQLHVPLFAKNGCSFTKDSVNSHRKSSYIEKRRIMIPVLHWHMYLNPSNRRRVTYWEAFTDHMGSESADYYKNYWSEVLQLSVRNATETFFQALLLFHLSRLMFFCI